MRHFTLCALLLLCYISADCKSLKHYKKGYYYTEAGEKMEGFIIYVPGLYTIGFKLNESAKKTYIKIKDLKAVVLTEGEYDSLSVKTDSDGERYFAKLLFESPNTKFYHKTVRVSQSGSPTMVTGVQTNMGSRGSAPAFTHTIGWTTKSYPGTASIIMYSDGEQTHALSRKNYNEVLLKALADSPNHITQLKNKDVKYSKLEEFLESYNPSKAK